MALIDARVLAPFQTRRDRCRDASGMRAEPEKVVLGVVPGHEPSSKPPVRIFLGTEPAQYRAERIFVWSIEKVRDPSRVYEIYLMKELAGFDRRKWLTGFTNYRFAIPHFAGGHGRAIWNDVDQVYKSDPAELFDMDLADHGFLTVPALGPNRRVDSSVMLMDCERMLPVWSLERAQRVSSKVLIRRAVAIPGLHGLLASEWNARDSEYVAGHSKLIHYTILHTQPWCPVPQRYVYQRNPIGETWYELERGADAAGFQVFTRLRNSASFRRIASTVRSAAHGVETPHSFIPRKFSAEALAELRDLCDRNSARKLLDVGPWIAGSGHSLQDQLPGHEVAEAGIFTGLGGESVPEFDGVVCTDGLAHLPDEDVPWVVEELFERARGFVYVTVCEPAPPRRLPDGQTLAARERGWVWWRLLFEKASARHPDLSWKLVVSQPENGAMPSRRQCEGGKRTSPPSVWVLNDGSPTHDNQSLGLARALGWSYEEKRLRFSRWSWLGVLAEHGLPLGFDESGSASLARPFPDLVIASGRRASGVARWLGEQSSGVTRVVQLDRRASLSDDPFDVVVSNEAGERPPGPRRIETSAPLTAIDPDRLERLAEAGELVWQGAARPRVALLVGGTTASHSLEPELAGRMASEVRDLAESRGGAVLALRALHTSERVLAAVEEGLGRAGRVVQLAARKHDGATDDVTAAALAAADAIVVTEESPARLALAGATGRPVYIYSLPRRRPSLRARIGGWIEERAQAGPINGRGTVRPQQGLEYLCARLVERGLVRGPRDTDDLQRALVEQKIAEPFGAPLRTGQPTALREADDVARRLRPLLGFAAT